MAKIKLNGKNYSIHANTTLSSIIKKHKINTKKIAIEVNGKIIQKNNYRNVILRELDKVEIVHFIGGG